MLTGNRSKVTFVTGHYPNLKKIHFSLILCSIFQIKGLVNFIQLKEIQLVG